jgi:hypothetical protein
MIHKNNERQYLKYDEEKEKIISAYESEEVSHCLRATVACQVCRPSSFDQERELIKVFQSYACAAGDGSQRVIGHMHG